MRRLIFDDLFVPLCYEYVLSMFVAWLCNLIETANSVEMENATPTPNTQEKIHYLETLTNFNPSHLSSGAHRESPLG